MPLILFLSVFLTFELVSTASIKENDANQSVDKIKCIETNESDCQNENKSSSVDETESGMQLRQMASFLMEEVKRKVDYVKEAIRIRRLNILRRLGYSFLTDPHSNVVVLYKPHGKIYVGLPSKNDETNFIWF